MEKNNLKSGFTLIELLVVIAIIGILASVVMGAVTTGRARAANTAVKANLSNLRTQAAIVAGSVSPNSYANVCTDTSFVAGLTSAGTAGGTPAVCFDAANSWVVGATLNILEGTDTTHWCADSAGKSEGITLAQYSAITSATTLCP